MAKLGTAKRPAVVHVRTVDRAEEIVSVCDQHGWKVIVGLEPDEPEDIWDVEALLTGERRRSVTVASAPSVGRNDPCPCGSGEKFKFCCGKTSGKGKYPIGTVAYYGPDDKICTKVVAGVIKSDNAEPILERFVGTGVYGNPKIADQIKTFFAKHRVKNVVVTDGIFGCPHEEGEDFPHGEDCPFCPFWRGKQGSARKD